MEFYQRVKQKLADEIEGDSPLEYPEGTYLRFQITTAEELKTLVKFSPPFAIF